MQVTLEISRDRVADLLCCGMEGGIGYWAQIDETVAPGKGADLRLGFEPEGHWVKEIYNHIHYPMCEAGGYLTLSDRTGEGFPDDLETRMLDYKSLCEGMQIMAEKYPRHFGNFMNAQEDAETGDVFIQCCVFGEIVFG